MENSKTDVSAPTADAVSYSLRGEPCLLTVPATSYAAAEVSGALALLQSAYDEPVAASLRRLLTTANGRPDVPNTLVGAGEVQVYDALTRPMQVSPEGDDLGAGTVQQQPQVLNLPPEPDDVLRSTRENAVWWGLLAGGRAAAGAGAPAGPGPAAPPAVGCWTIALMPPRTRRPRPADMTVPHGARSVFTDGACSGNPGPGGWAWAAVDLGLRLRPRGAPPPTSGWRSGPRSRPCAPTTGRCWSSPTRRTS